MKVLFDQGTPDPLRRHLPGHTIATAYEEGWSALENGELLQAAEANGFAVLVTTDQSLPYQQSLGGRSIGGGRGPGAAAITPSPAIADLLGGLARLKLTQRVADRGERHRDALVALEHRADLGRAHRARRHGLQDFFNHPGIGPALRSPARGTAARLPTATPGPRRSRRALGRCLRPGGRAWGGGRAARPPAPS